MKKIIYLMLFVLSYAANSQSLQIFDIDTTDFPTMRAKFYAVDANGKQARPTISELQLKEDGIERQITNVSCPPKKQRRLSVCIMVDTYQYIDLARAGTERLINFLDMPNEDEIAVTYMSGKPLIHQDFTKDKTKALEKAATIPTAPGVDINSMFNSPYTGGIPFIKDRSSDKKVLILVSDLHCPNLNINEQKLIAEAKANNISIYSVLLNSSDYSGLFNSIASATDAILFENVKTETQIYNIFEEIAFIENNKPCDIEWTSNVVCTLEVNIELVWNHNVSAHKYIAKSNAISSLLITPKFINYGNRVLSSINDTIITIKAIESDYTIISIKNEYEASDINIVNLNLPIFIPKNTNKSITIRFSPSDSNTKYTSFDLQTDKCSANFSIYGGFPGKKLEKKSIKLTYPNGGELFYAGSDSVITWKGISHSDTVSLSLSIDSGKYWTQIANNVTGGTYIWKNIPVPRSSKSLIRVLQKKKQISYLDSNYINTATLYGHQFMIYTVKFSPDGKYIATGGNDKKIRIWDSKTGILLDSINCQAEISRIFYNNDGKRMFVSANGVQMIIDVQTGNIIHSFSGVESGGSDYSSDGNIIISSKNNDINVYDANTGILMKTLLGHTDFIDYLKFSHSGKLIASMDYKDDIILWDVNTGNKLRKLIGSNLIAFSPDDNKIFTIYNDTGTIYDANTGVLLLNLNEKTGNIYSAIFSSDGSKIVTGSLDGTAQIWDANTGKLISRLTGHDMGFISVAISLDGNSIVTGSFDGTAKIWELIEDPLQEDQSDSVFSIITPEPRFKNINIDMGKVIVGSSKDALIDTVLCNIGDAPLHVLGVDVTNGDISEFQVPRGAGDFYLPANECRDMMFAFMPNQVGIRNAKITVKSTIGDYVDTINITGEGIQPTLEIVNPYIDFGALELGMTKDSLKALTVKNISTKPITIDNSKHNKPNDVDFSTLAGAGSFTLAPNESKEMDLRFRPSEGGRTNGTLEFHYNNIGSPAIIQLFGEGIGGTLKISSDSAFAGEMRQFKLQLAKMKPSALLAVADNFEVKIKFQGTIITPTSANLISQKSNDSTYMTLKGVIGSSNDLVIFNLIAGLGSVDETSIDIEEIKLFDAQGNLVFYDLERESGNFKLLGVCYEGGARLINPSGQAAQILSISPNPAENWLDLEVSLIEKGATEISIFNINGEKVKTLLNEEIETTGNFKFNSDLQNISSGQYYIILKTPTYIETNQLIIVK